MALGQGKGRRPGVAGDQCQDEDLTDGHLEFKFEGVVPDRPCLIAIRKSKAHLNTTIGTPFTLWLRSESRPENRNTTLNRLTLRVMGGLAEKSRLF